MCKEKDKRKKKYRRKRGKLARGVYLFLCWTVHSMSQGHRGRELGAVSSATGETSLVVWD